MTATKRLGRPGYDLESLLGIAARLFHERGYDGTTMGDLSQELGITKSAIYHHVRSKEDLLERAVNRALDALFAVADEVNGADGRAIDQLEQLIRGSVRVLVEELPFVTLLLRIRGNTKVQRAALARRREFDHVVADLVARAEADGDIRPDVDPATTAKLLFGMVNSLTEWYQPRPGSDVAALAEAVARIAFDGIRVQPVDSGIGGGTR